MSPNPITIIGVLNGSISDKNGETEVVGFDCVTGQLRISGYAPLSFLRGNIGQTVTFKHKPGPRLSIVVTGRLEKISGDVYRIV